MNDVCVSVFVRVCLAPSERQQIDCSCVSTQHPDACQTLKGCNDQLLHQCHCQNLCTRLIVAYVQASAEQKKHLSLISNRVNCAISASFAALLSFTYNFLRCVQQCINWVSGSTHVSWLQVFVMACRPLSDSLTPNSQILRKKFHFITFLTFSYEISLSSYLSILHQSINRLIEFCKDQPSSF